MWIGYLVVMMTMTMLMTVIAMVMVILQAIVPANVMWDQLWTRDHGQMHKMVWHVSLAVRHDVEKGLRAVYKMVWPAS